MQAFAPGGGGENLAATPTFLSHLRPAGLKGLVMAGLLASFMSTFDSYLLCWSSSIVQDIIAPLRRGRLCLGLFRDFLLRRTV